MDRPKSQLRWKSYKMCSSSRSILKSPCVGDHDRPWKFIEIPSHLIRYRFIWFTTDRLVQEVAETGHMSSVPDGKIVKGPSFF